MPRVTGASLNYDRRDYQWWVAVTALAITAGALVGGVCAFVLYAVGAGWYTVPVAIVAGVMLAAKAMQVTARDSP